MPTISSTLRRLSLLGASATFGCYAPALSDGDAEGDGTGHTESDTTGHGEGTGRSGDNDGGGGTGEGTDGTGTGGTDDGSGDGTGTGGADDDSGDGTGGTDDGTGDDPVDSVPPQIDLFTVNGSQNPLELDEAGFVELFAEVSDDVGVARVVFYEGSQKVAEVEEAPYQARWLADRPSINGTYEFTVRAYDTADNEAVSAPISLSVYLPPTGTEMWTKLHGADRLPNAVDVHGDGRAVIVGNESTSNKSDIFVLKLDEEGDEDWYKTHGSMHSGMEGTDFGSDVAVRGDDIYVAGTVNWVRLDGDLVSDTSIWIRKYTAGGQVQWTEEVEVATLLFPVHGTITPSLALTSDAVYVSAALWDDDNETTRPSLTKYGHDKALAWSDSDDGIMGYARGVAASATGIHVAVADTGGDQTDMALLPYAPNGDARATIERSCNPAADDVPTDIAVDAEGNLYVSGTFCGDGGLLKFDAAGEFQWGLDSEDLFTLDDDADDIDGVAIDPEGHVAFIATREYHDNDGTVRDQSIFVAKYDADKNQLWAHTIGTDEPGNDHGWAVATDEVGYVYAAGRRIFEERDDELLLWVGKFSP